MVEVSKGKGGHSSNKIVFVILIEIHDKVWHVGTICRVAFVNLTDQTGPKRVEMSEKTCTYKKKMT